eukprot:XP_028336056.1 uncharacterized protein LOC114484378 isoform X2 [Physeter catodon]
MVTYKIKKSYSCVPGCQPCQDIPLQNSPLKINKLFPRSRQGSAVPATRLHQTGPQKADKHTRDVPASCKEEYPLLQKVLSPEVARRWNRKSRPSPREEKRKAEEVNLKKGEASCWKAGGVCAGGPSGVCGESPGGFLWTVRPFRAPYLLTPPRPPPVRRRGPRGRRGASGRCPGPSGARTVPGASRRPSMGTRFLCWARRVRNPRC